MPALTPEETTPRLERITIQQPIYPVNFTSRYTVDLSNQRGDLQPLTATTFSIDMGVTLSVQETTFAVTDETCPSGEQDVIFFMASATDLYPIDKCLLGRLFPNTYQQLTDTEHGSVEYVPDVDYVISNINVTRQPIQCFFHSPNIPEINKIVNVTTYPFRAIVEISSQPYDPASNEGDTFDVRLLYSYGVFDPNAPPTPIGVPVSIEVSLGGNAVLGTDYILARDPAMTDLITTSVFSIIVPSTPFISIGYFYGMRLTDGLAEAEETVTFTLTSTPAYDLDPNYNTSSITILANNT